MVEPLSGVVVLASTGSSKVPSLVGIFIESKISVTPSVKIILVRVSEVSGRILISSGDKGLYSFECREVLDRFGKNPERILLTRTLTLGVSIMWS